MKYLKLLLILNITLAQKIIIPMDKIQNDHLKAYGIAYFSISKGHNVEWLLNYRGGSFLIDNIQSIKSECKVRGITFENINSSELLDIYSIIEENNMDIVLLEKKPKIAIYTPPNKQPWDDAVTLALTYAEIDYETLWDEDVHFNKLKEYDWLHLHHEDFTGQYGKFYRAYRNASWYIQQQKNAMSLAKELGYEKVSQEKLAIVKKIKEYLKDLT